MSHRMEAKTPLKVDHERTVCCPPLVSRRNSQALTGRVHRTSKPHERRPRTALVLPLLLLFLTALLPALLLTSCNSGGSGGSGTFGTPGSSRTYGNSGNIPGNRSNLKPHQQEALKNHTFQDWDGNPVRVSDYRGKVVIVDFWETWCGPCLRAFPGFQRALDEHPDDLVVIAATLGSRDTREIALDFIDGYDYSFVFVDGSSLAPKLGIRGIPFKVVVDREGEVDGYMTGSVGGESEYQLLKSLVRDL